MAGKHGGNSNVTYAFSSGTHCAIHLYDLQIRIRGVTTLVRTEKSRRNLIAPPKTHHYSPVRRRGDWFLWLRTDIYAAHVYVHTWRALA